MHTTVRGVATLCLALSACVVAQAQAQEGTAARKAIWPENFPKSGLPYSPGILVGNTLYISGQLGRDPATAQLVPGGIEAETRQAMANARKVLQAAGMDFQNVVSVNVFLASFSDFAAFNETYRGYFAVDPPARATAQAGLNLNARIEIQMVAVK
jgi:2-iminobutanoate/2-iminopropanoate deaminase